MKLKLLQLVNSASALKKLNSQSVKARVAFRLKKIGNLINTELLAYEETRLKLLNEYGQLKKDDSTQFEFVDKDNAKKFNHEMRELLESEIELPVAQLSFSDIEDVSMSAEDLQNIEWLIDMVSANE